MPLSSIVIIVLRLLILNWLLQDIAWLMSSLFNPPYERSLKMFLSFYGPVSLLLIGAIALWVLAPFVARLISRGAEATVTMGSVSRYDLYTFGFVFLGLYFAISSVADTINWLHFFATVKARGDALDGRVQNLYQLTKPLLTFAAGLVSLLGARRWAKKLVAYE